MAKVVHEKIWCETQGTVTKIGFNQSFLDTLEECWHILPANLEKIKVKSPLCTVESNDSLISILSPIGGNFMTWNEKATNFPDKLTENDIVMELSSVAVENIALFETANGPAEGMFVRLGENAINQRWAIPEALQRPQAPRPQRFQIQPAVPQMFAEDEPF